MTTPLQDAYLVAAMRTPVARRNGAFRHARPDDLLAHALRELVARAPGLDPAEIADVIVGCAMPEAEQGMNVARIGLLLAGLPASVPGFTVNRFCASGLQAVADAAARIRSGEADVMIAAGVESMTVMTKMMGNRVRPNPAFFEHDEHRAIAWGMGLTAEEVAKRWQVSRAEQDAFAVESHRRAVAAIDAGRFADEIAPFVTTSSRPGSDGQPVRTTSVVTHDEGPRRDASPERIGALRPVFAADGSVTAGNASQMSDGAAAVLLMSEAALKRSGLQPIARFVAHAVAGVPPEVMGIGPVEAIPRVLARAGWSQDSLDWIELNEAFAAQAIAVRRTLGIDPAQINPLGGAIALGHPLGATGAIRTATLLAAMKRGEARRGMVTMCIGTGMGAAGVIERV